MRMQMGLHDTLQPYKESSHGKCQNITDRNRHRGEMRTLREAVPNPQTGPVQHHLYSFIRTSELCFIKDRHH